MRMLVVIAVFLFTSIAYAVDYTNSLGISFKYITAGTFMMGSPESEPERHEDEKQHQVTLTKPYYIATTEVTQAQWQAVMGHNPSYFSSCGSDCPVDDVSWNDVQKFIKKINLRGEGHYRLPTEAEWEYAARAGTTTVFSFANNITTAQVNYHGNYPYDDAAEGEYRDTAVAVGSLPANNWGLYEMHGNVWEWVQDWYDSYPSTAVTDPTGPKTGNRRCKRSGSWNDVGGFGRSADRSWHLPDKSSSLMGFRLVMEP
jgi:formylglycine-generating enzyme required for sulfatase activity